MECVVSDLFFKDLEPGEFFECLYYRRRGRCMKATCVNDMGAGALNAVNERGRMILVLQHERVRRLVCTWGTEPELSLADHKRMVEDVVNDVVRKHAEETASRIRQTERVVGNYSKKVERLIEGAVKLETLIESNEEGLCRGAENRLKLRADVHEKVGALAKSVDELGERVEGNFNFLRRVIAPVTERVSALEDFGVHDTKPADKAIRITEPGLYRVAPLEGGGLTMVEVEE
jgi:hypothetical protein